MSSIRLFILSSFAEFGPMHGHLLRSVAERMKAPLWTDISVGAVYGAMKRLADEGLLKEQGREREGNRPTRQIYEITDEGRRVLAELQRDGLSEVWFKFDPFDLALAWVDPRTRKLLPAIIAKRLETARGMLAECRRLHAQAQPHFGLAKHWALKHTEYRLEAEVAYLSDLSKAAGDIAAEKPQRRGQVKTDPAKVSP